VKNFHESKGLLWRLSFDAENQEFVWRCLGSVMEPSSGVYKLDVNLPAHTTEHCLCKEKP
jgi:hypothetical protein